MIRVTFDIDPAGLASVTDSHLAALWHIGQANPAPHGDRQAGELAGAVGFEIVRRWLAACAPELYAHQPGDHHWKTLLQHGLWAGPGGAWVPHAAGAPEDSPPTETKEA
ncbi:MAG TPA: hypothetical protein PKC59_00895 [Burkholderiaceae bacterium]|nr:hypothetical protein [Burkholderiaceae bacterium]HMX09447.1 hypothetical protein [Burkholderiaceae bacterium]HMY99061.1 hypothetical protein [Burkholderiaceae bacterium]HNB43373.1 hypothetical protein [Burkholderiaceae bacterium]HNG77921.1 hypothetical protein [Burkholderiaceae bacterium]